MVFMLISFFKVKGSSMLPNYKEGDYLLINKLTKPKKGDAVVLKHPKTNELILKRVSRINGNKVFVTGDNKEFSKDSRHFGFVDRKYILGRVLFHIKKNLN